MTKKRTAAVKAQDAKGDERPVGASPEGAREHRDKANALEQRITDLERRVQVLENRPAVGGHE